LLAEYQFGPPVGAITTSSYMPNRNSRGAQQAAAATAA